MVHLVFDCRATLATKWFGVRVWVGLRIPLYSQPQPQSHSHEQLHAMCSQSQRRQCYRWHWCHMITHFEFAQKQNFLGLGTPNETILFVIRAKFSMSIHWQSTAKLSYSNTLQVYTLAHEFGTKRKIMQKMYQYGRTDDQNWLSF